MENNWYILNVIAGQEHKIANQISLMINDGNHPNICEVLVPSKLIIKVKKGQKVQESQKLFPGYVFINAELDSKTQNVITSIPKAMGFLGGKNNPQKVSEEKIKDIFSLISSGSVQINNSQTFDIGESLKITDGPFESFSGIVEEFDQEKQKVKISVLIFGRSTSVELDVNQVEKML